MVKAIMHGCNGKMGQVISGLVKEDDVIEIVAGIDKFTGKQKMHFLTIVWKNRFLLFFAQQDFLRNSLQR